MELNVGKYKLHILKVIFVTPRHVFGGQSRVAEFSVDE